MFKAPKFMVGRDVYFRTEDNTIGHGEVDSVMSKDGVYIYMVEVMDELDENVIGIQKFTEEKLFSYPGMIM